LQLQGIICGCLNPIIVRLGKKIIPVSDKLFGMFCQVITQCQPSGSTEQSPAAEESLMAIASLAHALGPDFESYMPEFNKILLTGLRSHEDVSFCKICIENVGNLATQLQKGMKPYCEPLMHVLHAVLQNPVADRSLKPRVMVAVGDVAMAIAGDFQPFLEPFLELLGQASRTKYDHGPTDNEEWIEYIQELRDGVMAAYTGILYGLLDGGKLDLLKFHVNVIVELVTAIVEDSPTYACSSNLEGAVDITTDLINAYQAEIVGPLIKAPFFEAMINLAQTNSSEKIRLKAVKLGEIVKPFKVA